MHNWGDDNVDWSGISASAEYIARGLRKWWRVPVRDWKEKYGTVRVYCGLGWYQFHDLTHPGYIRSQYPTWLWRLDCRYGSRICAILNYIVVPLHCWAYRRYYAQAVKRWPHLRLEILSGADYSELLAPLGVHYIATGPNSYAVHIEWREGDWVQPREEESIDE